ncbi:hypothetical protein ACOV1W_03740 [Paraclostridium bifermentans]|uniref:hypothetical protein n=1 Tax=Paraclostridium bifermentans TaxID=1490 RepID=UPI003D2B7EBB
MKVGVRKPSIKKSISARTTGRAKRAVKKAVVPGYGKKGSGWVKDPKKAAYNKIYNKTTVSATKLVSSKNSSTKSKSSYSSHSSYSGYNSIDSNFNLDDNTIPASQEVAHPFSNIKLIDSKGNIKYCKIGYSWTNLFLMCWLPLMRLDFKNFLIQLLAIVIGSKISILFWFVCWLGFPIVYNKMYINDLLKKGYIPFNEHYKELLNKNGIKCNIYHHSNEYAEKVTNEEQLYSFDNLNNNSEFDLTSLDDNIDITEYFDFNDTNINEEVEINELAPDGYHKMFYYEKLVGVTFENREVFVENFINGSNRNINIVREQNNPYDPNAIKVFGTCELNNKPLSGELGYIEASTACKLKDFKDIYVTLSSVKLPNKIRLDIWISNEDKKNIEENEKLYEDVFSNTDKGYELNKKGMELEKSKDIDGAIEYYEQSIDCNFDGTHPYDRLAILYRKKKDYDNEIRVLDKAIYNFKLLSKVRLNSNYETKISKFNNRLEKTYFLKNKS